MTNFNELTTPSGFDTYDVKHLSERHDSTLRYDISDITDDGDFHDLVYKDAPNHEGSDRDLSDKAFAKRSTMEGGLLHDPFIQTNNLNPGTVGRNAVDGRVISHPICPGLRGAQDNGVYFTTVIKSTLNVKSMIWAFTNRGRPDTGQFAGDSFTIASGGPNEYIVPWEQIFSSMNGFLSGLQPNSDGGRNKSNPWLYEYMSTSGASTELGPSQLVGFSAPGIYDVKLSVTFQYGLTERTIEVDKPRYIQIQPNFNEDDAAYGQQENFVNAL